jgi:hypothetical protein
MRRRRPAADGGTGDGTGDAGAVRPAEASPLPSRYDQARATLCEADGACVLGHGVRPAHRSGRAFQLAPGLPGADQ